MSKESQRSIIPPGFFLRSPLIGPEEPTISSYPGFSNITADIQFSSVAQSCLTLCDPMNRSTPGLPVYHQLPEFTQDQRLSAA